MDGLSTNPTGQKLLAAVAVKMGRFDWSRDWVDCNGAMAAEVRRPTPDY